MTDLTTTLAASDTLAALTGIANANLLDGIADGYGEVHTIQVVLWRNFGADDDDLLVIVHVDHISVRPYSGSPLRVNLGNLSHAATQVVVRAERLAAEELDRREVATAQDAAQTDLDALLELAPIRKGVAL